MNNINSKFKMLLKYNVRKILFLFFRLIKFFIKKKNYIIIQSYSPFSYSENLDICSNTCSNIQKVNSEYFGIQSRK